MREQCVFVLQAVDLTHTLVLPVGVRRRQEYFRGLTQQSFLSSLSPAQLGST